jgi:hypothetical protein
MLQFLKQLRGQAVKLPTVESLLDAASLQSSLVANPWIQNVKSITLSEAKKGEDRQSKLKYGLDAVLGCRWRLKYNQAHWAELPVETTQFRGALAFVDRLLPRLAEAVEEAYPGHLRHFVLPEGIPDDGTCDALGPIFNLVHLDAVLGRQTALPGFPKRHPWDTLILAYTKQQNPNVDYK